jgi:hypothetical protein
VTTDKNDWENFCARASATMRDALENRITLEKATEFFENDKSISDPDLRRSVEWMISEIDGSRKFYMEMLGLFESRATEAEIVQYLNSQKTSIQEAMEFIRAFFLKLKRPF